jgi:hypothetical protein
VPFIRRSFAKDGHFYSPVVDAAAIAREAGRVWPEQPEVLGLDFDDRSHVALLTDAFPRFLPQFDYPAVTDRSQPARYCLDNPQFAWLDARALFVMLRTLRPARMIEVGCGHSSLLTADVNTRWLAGGMEFTCIEPYPPAFLGQPIAGITRLLPQRVQDVPLAEFARLGAGDVLFIDSSHVAKTGSDVNHLYFEVVPRLQPGVVIHIHDIFLPDDYPKDWVLKERRSWNEQYLVRALLMWSKGLEVVFGCSYAMRRHTELVARALGGTVMGGGSLWLRRI